MAEENLQLDVPKDDIVKKEAENLSKLSGVLNPKLTDILGRTGKARSTKDLMNLRTEATQEQLGSMQREQEAAIQIPVQKAEAKGEYARQEAQSYQKIDDERRQKMAAAQVPDFNPSQDNLMTLATIASLTAVVGAVVGGQGGLSGLGAIQSMTGMLKGYQAGRKDVFDRERVKFEKDMATLKAKQESLMREFEAAYKRIPYDLAGARADMEVTLAKYDSKLLKATLDKQGPEVVLKRIEEAGKDIRHLESMTAKALGAGKGGGSKSAINERFQNTVIRSANETLRSLELMENIGIDIGKGGLGGVVGKGTMTSEALANISRKMTSQDQLRYNAAAGGMALELAYVMNGGYKPNESQITELKNLYLSTPQDSYETAAFKFADVVAKLKAAIEVAPAYTEDQKKNNQMLLEKLQRYATPEEILQKINGEPVKSDPYVRAGGEKPKPTQQDIDYARAHPEVRQRFIDRFGVEP